MAGGIEGMKGSRELDETPTWAVSLVCAVIIIISLLLEKTIHLVGKVIYVGLITSFFLLIYHGVMVFWCCFWRTKMETGVVRIFFCINCAIREFEMAWSCTSNWGRFQLNLLLNMRIWWIGLAFFIYADCPWFFCWFVDLRKEEKVCFAWSSWENQGG